MDEPGKDAGNGGHAGAASGAGGSVAGNDAAVTSGGSTASSSGGAGASAAGGSGGNGSVDPSGTGGDGTPCMAEQVTLHIRQDGMSCFLDLPPRTDLTAPISFMAPFGMLLMTFQLNEVTGQCETLISSGWQHTTMPNTIQICGQACSLFFDSPYAVWAGCGPG